MIKVALAVVTACVIITTTIAVKHELKDNGTFWMTTIQPSDIK